jgi:hypothetical protein
MPHLPIGSWWNMDKLMHFYFDWNVFQRIKNPITEQHKFFAKFIYDIKDYIFIAYSPFHILDLLKNFDKSEQKWNYIFEDCNLISEITKNLYIHRDLNNEIQREYQNPLDVFKNQLDTELLKGLLNPSKIWAECMSKTQKEEFKQNIDTAQKNVLSNPIESPFANIISDSQNEEEAFEKIVLYFTELFSNPQTYKDMRTNLKEVFQLLKTLPQSEKDVLNNKLKSRGFDKKINEFNSDDWLQLAKEFQNPQTNTDIANNYLIKDLFGITSQEKIDSKNDFRNINNDSLHLEMANYSLYYITEDIKNLEKSKLMLEEKKMDTEIFTIEEANRFLRVNVFTYKEG